MPLETNETMKAISDAISGLIKTESELSKHTGLGDIEKNNIIKDINNCYIEISDQKNMAVSSFILFLLDKNI